ncbi:MAG TPA: putative maltokinase, partial [Burkholderiales bacterium]|nr:putative maltokinase [Burkholderiales bacterium]
LTLPAHSFYWFRLGTDVPVPSWYEQRTAPEEPPILILFDGWTSFFRDRVVPWRIAMAEKTRAQFEEEVLPRYVQPQRWYAAKGEALKAVRLIDHVLWETRMGTWMISMFSTEGAPEPACYFLPLALAWEDTEEDRLRALTPVRIARVRQQASVGAMGDAFGDEMFCRAVAVGIGRGVELATAHGKVRFVPTRAYAQLAGDDVGALPVTPPQGQSSNTIVTLGEKLFLKAYRRIRRGVNPEVEIGRYLTEVAEFPNCVPLAGVLEHVDETGALSSLAILQGYVRNQGDAWTYTLEYLARFFDTHRAGTEVAADAHGAYLSLVQTLGMRTAELHAAFARRTGDPAFDPEPASEADYAEWKRRVREDAASALDLLARRADQILPTAAAEARDLLERRDQVLGRIDALRMPAATVLKTRHHGDYHLGQVLISRNDFIIIDFEGEPARPIEERRRKHSPIRDVAGIVRSFSYAAGSALSRAVESPDDEARLGPLAADWETQTRNAFLTAYDETARAAHVYASDADFRALVELFELEKALYELKYELNNRPDWVRWPLAGIRRLVP